MPLKTRHRGNAAEYGILLALVAGVSIYGLQTLGPAFSGNFKKVDSIGTMSLLAPLGGASKGSSSSPGKPGGDNLPGAGSKLPVSGSPDGFENVINNPNQISESPRYDNSTLGGLGTEGTVDSENGANQNNKPGLKPSQDSAPSETTSVSGASTSVIEASAPIYTYEDVQTVGTSGNSEEP